MSFRYGLRSRKISSKDQNEFLYKIPSSIIEKFGKVALENKYLNRHIETLALITGVWSGNEIIAKDLIFPKQRGSSTDVEDLGKTLQTFKAITH